MSWILIKNEMPWPGIEPGLLRPQRRVLTTERSRLWATEEVDEEYKQKQRALSIQPKIPEIPVQNQMERRFSQNLFRKFWSTSRGCRFSRKFGNSGNFMFHWAFHFARCSVPVSPAVIAEWKWRRLQVSLNQCSVCFFTSDDFEFFLRYLCVETTATLHLQMLPSVSWKLTRATWTISF